MIKFIKIRKNGQIVAQETEDGRFRITRNFGIGVGTNRWVLKTTDGSTPFNGYKRKPKDSHVELVESIAQAKEMIERYG
jgi:hypothetical protein